MPNKLKKSALAFAGLKAGQQILHDLDSVVLNNSVPDYIRFGGEQLCKIASAVIAAYTLDEAVGLAEEYLPKPVRGLLPLTTVTLGAGALINYFGNYFNAQESLGVLETTAQLINHYQENLAKLVTFNPDVNVGYLTGAFIGLKSGCRFLKNLGQTILNNAEKRRAQNKYQEKQKIDELKEFSEIPNGL